MYAPRCHACGAAVMNPQAGSCAYCRAPLASPPVPPPAPYGASPWAGYGPQGPPPGAPPVQAWASPPVPPQRSWWERHAYFDVVTMIRLGIVLVVLLAVGFGACISILVR